MKTDSFQRLVVKDTTWMTAQHIYNGVRDDNGDEYPIDTDDPQFCDREYKATLPVGSTLDDEIPAEVCLANALPMRRMNANDI